jgi:poly-gamma-glutamate capsule biosynthesis protein CapA/YwtB (metallophosphatase superfamily)
MGQENSVTIFAVGDIVPNREEPETLFALAAQVLGKGDIVTGQLEAVISDKAGYLDSSGWGPYPCQPANVKALTASGFNLISFASNNCLDYGPEAFLDTIQRLTQAGIKVIGAGRNIEEARKPAIFHIKGTKVGFLAYNSICFKGYAAREDAPGCVPMRAWTAYHQTEPEQPGTPCEVVTWAYQDDLEALIRDVHKLRPEVDVLAISIHWGIHHIPKTIAMYQAQIGHAAIDAGADIIFGHHPHILKGIEIYKEKAIFYSLNMFGFDWPRRKPRYGGVDDSAVRYNFTRDPEYPNFPFCHDALKTIVAKCVISDKEIKSISFLPSYVNKQNQPQILSSKSPHFNEVLEYMRDITVQQQLNAEYTLEGDEVVISSTGPSRRRWLPSIALPIVDR